MFTIQGASIITSIILLTLGIKDVNAYKQNIIQLYDNALAIKPMLYND